MGPKPGKVWFGRGISDISCDITKGCAFQQTVWWNAVWTSLTRLQTKDVTIKTGWICVILNLSFTLKSFLMSSWLLDENWPFKESRRKIFFCLVIIEPVVTSVGSLHELPFIADIFCLRCRPPSLSVFPPPSSATRSTQGKLSFRPSACKRVVLQSSGAGGG